MSEDRDLVQVRQLRGVVLVTPTVAVTVGVCLGCGQSVTDVLGRDRCPSCGHAWGTREQAYRVTVPGVVTTGAEDGPSDVADVGVAGLADVQWRPGVPASPGASAWDLLDQVKRTQALQLTVAELSGNVTEANQRGRQLEAIVVDLGEKHTALALDVSQLTRLICEVRDEVRPMLRAQQQRERETQSATFPGALKDPIPEPTPFTPTGHVTFSSWVRDELTRRRLDGADALVLLHVMALLVDHFDSGSSFEVAANLLIRLLSGLPLTTITDEADQWEDPMGTGLLWQHRRCSTVFRRSDGSVVHMVGSEQYPVVFPYYPKVTKTI